MKNPEEIFWLSALFKNITLVPVPCQTKAENLNTITRLILVILTGYLLLHFNSIILVLFLLIIIIILYYYQNTMKEKFTQISPPSFNINNRTVKEVPLSMSSHIPTGMNLKIQTPSQTRFCKDSIEIKTNDQYYSANQALVGKPNPKTLQPVVKVAPPAAFDYWNVNPSYIYNGAVNDSFQQDLYRSGYMVSTCKGDASALSSPVYENYQYNPKQLQNRAGDLIEFDQYNPKQLHNNLPSNLPSGTCDQLNVFRDYNEQLFTQNLGPDKFTRSEIIEPISSNIGISFTQQFPPVTQQGNTYIYRDPRLKNNEPSIQVSEPNQATYDNVYDPRFSGYGTSYRSYIDEMTGQPRFYYDDVDAIRRPNYIIRSNIDDAPFADSYGPMRNEQDRRKNDEFSRTFAQDKFLQDTLSHRNELQERLLRKRNNELWQLRQAPLRRDQGACKSTYRS